MNFEVVSHLITPSKIYSPYGGLSLTVSQFPSLSVYHNQSRSRSQWTETQQMASANEGHKQGSAKRVAVVGAGVSGLAAAYKLKLHGLNVTIFEAEGRAGGKLRSISQDGLIWDEGANTMTESEMEVGYLLDNLELRGKQQFTHRSNLSLNHRLCWFHIHTRMSQFHRTSAILQEMENLYCSICQIPSNPIALIRSNFLSTQSKFQIMLEPFLWKKRNYAKMSDAEESVGGFFQRHFGKEVVDYLIDPFVAGTCAGDPESLSMPHAFPELWNLEKEFGSIIFGAIRSKFSAKREKSGALNSSTNKKHQRGSFSFLGGMQTLTDALCKDLGKDELKLQSRVLELSYGCEENSVSECWSVSYAPIHDKQSEEQSFDAVVMTVSYLPLSVIITTFKKENVRRPLEGFGVLVPAKEQQNGLKTLGTLFSSMMFPDRAPSDLYLYTTFVGGSRNKELAKASTDELKQVVTSDLRQLLGAEGEPTFKNHFFWSKAFPLYGHNYDAVLQAIEKMEVNLPGFFYAGNHRGGLSVGKALSSGCKAADLVISYLESSYDDKLSGEKPC
ncbi:protoporphyrinogen oxidase, mitochondrial isoform X2 [Camellia sinensis]|uniref:protoporphyrinogen oxidase, mitochondrial isoform X2 n=1 Tax=Camellia sinensis TaxID=4442 RepID=UPI001036D53B|nr:protoporphyrinogen oxidase, mitochondrial isoform X2 [Camellia sinensis]